MIGGDREYARAELVLLGNFGEAGIDALAHFVLIDIARLGLVEQLAFDHPSADIERIAGDYRISGQGQRQPHFVRHLAGRADLHFQREIRGPPMYAGIEAHRHYLEPRRFFAGFALALIDAPRIGSERRIGLGPGFRTKWGRCNQQAGEGQQVKQRAR